MLKKFTMDFQKVRFFKQIHLQSLMIVVHQIQNSTNLLKFDPMKIMKMDFISHLMVDLIQKVILLMVIKLQVQIEKLMLLEVQKV